MVLAAHAGQSRRPSDLVFVWHARADDGRQDRSCARPAIAVALLTLRPNVWHEGSVALLDELYVVPALRGQGIGSELVDRAEAVAQQRGAEVLEINVDGQDVDARRFYERHGYTNTEPGQDEPMLYYYKRLGP